MKKEEISTNSLAHSKWNCKYHIVFAPKYRRKVFYEDKRLEIREILRKLCEWKGVEIVEGWVVSKRCMAERPIKNALVRSQYWLGLCPKLKYPPVIRGDIYCL